MVPVVDRCGFQVRHPALEPVPYVVSKKGKHAPAGLFLVTFWATHQAHELPSLPLKSMGARPATCRLHTQWLLHLCHKYSHTGPLRATHRSLRIQETFGKLQPQKADEKRGALSVNVFTRESAWAWGALPCAEDSSCWQEVWH